MLVYQKMLMEILILILLILLKLEQLLVRYALNHGLNCETQMDIDHVRKDNFCFLLIIFSVVLCFNSMYHWTLLEQGYSMTNENLKNFHIVKTVHSNEIGWTLGYMINQTNYLSPEYRPSRLLTKGEFGGLLFLCLFFIILSIFIAILARLHVKRLDNY